MAELVDALDLKSSGLFGCAGSSPAPGTIISPTIRNKNKWCGFPARPNDFGRSGGKSRSGYNNLLN